MLNCLKEIKKSGVYLWFQTEEDEAEEKAENERLLVSFQTDSPPVALNSLSFSVPV